MNDFAGKWLLPLICAFAIGGMLAHPKAGIAQSGRTPPAPRPQYAQPQARPPVQQPLRPGVRRPARPGAPSKQPAASETPTTPTLVQGFNWKRVDVHWNIVFQALDAYSSAFGFAFTPHYRLASGFAMGLSAGAQLIKLSDSSKMVLAEGGLFAEIPIDSSLFLKADAGMANPIPRDQSMLKPIFPYFGAGIGVRVGGKASLIQSLSFQYHMLMSDEKAHQILLGVGLGW